MTVSPLPGSRDATPQTQISFLGVPAAELSDVTVSGSHTGPHSGRLAAYSQGDGASFQPSRPFAEGELVTVRARLHSGAGAGAVQPLFDQFQVAHQDAISSTPETIHSGSPSEIQSFRSRPGLRPPVLTVTASSPAVAPGDELVAPYDGPGQSGPMILEPGGGLVWFKGLPRGTSATNLQVQQYSGKPVLTWWQGDISVHGFGRGEDVIADSAYEDIAHVRAGNGLQADLHELQLTPAGTALITAYDPIYCNLSGVGGSSYGAVTDSLLQEIDVRTGLVMFQWTSLDHVALGESYALARPTRARAGRLTSSTSTRSASPRTAACSSRRATPGRSTTSIPPPDRSNGSSAASTRASRWAPARAPPGSTTRANCRPGRSASSTTAPRRRSTTSRAGSSSASTPSSTPPRSSASSREKGPRRRSPTARATLQALPNGDWLIGWGQVPDLSELSPTGQLLFDAHFPAGDQSYRDFRFPWTGAPAHPPAFAVAGGSGGASTTVYASWNGATLVASWQVLAGSSATHMKVVAQRRAHGL